MGSTKPVKLSSFKGKPVLIDFWATWCGPCRETMPELQKLHQEFGPKGLEIIAISSDPEPAVEKFLKDNPYTYPMYIDLDNSANTKFGVTGLPTSFVLDRNGKVIWTGHPGDVSQLRRAVQAVIG
jgi:cytochrome c biogenesis protein CcmG, thiol:disulfide interchange protein DsbE